MDLLILRNLNSYSNKTEILHYLICMLNIYKYLYVYDGAGPRFPDLNLGSRDEEPCNSKASGRTEA